MLTRRQILRASLAGGFGLSVSRALERLAFAAPSPEAKTRSIILLWMNGGPSHLDTWDPKQGKVAGDAKSIKTNVPGISISEHMPNLARAANKLAIVRGMTSKEGNHQRAQYLLRTGYAPTPTVPHPTLAAWASKRLGEPSTGLPASVSLGGPSLGAGFFGVQYGPFVVQGPGQLPDNVAYGPAVDASRFDARKALLADMETSFSASTGDAKVEGRRAVYAKADRLMHASALRTFDVSEEPEAVRAAFGDTAFGRGCLTAVRLVGAGVRFVEVALDGWDTHQDNFGRTKKLMGTLDPAMSALLAELERRSLASNTVVAWMGDFGRTPKINGNDGRDHHPAAWSAVLAGGGIRGGITHGETDADGEKVVKDAVSVPNLLATIATAVGLDPGDTAQSPAGRPISLTDHGVPVKALLA
ncbi:hypothetical protein AKJ09_07527 [Labilithrix luteola]|uniref:DUF1501 domain-containing protein n=1 Tax=Labilithrix luteola TaxID=1391654 RepID=A0A0K1Q570_9BACT|nr:DUF1501 domain-containing protein [Labilithrix luteola]AKV00864.1 hypothetical protein AKJ09_07527 [Labilithrix luteola]